MISITKLTEVMIQDKGHSRGSKIPRIVLCFNIDLDKFSHKLTTRLNKIDAEYLLARSSLFFGLL